MKYTLRMEDMIPYTPFSIEDMEKALLELEEEYIMKTEFFKNIKQPLLDRGFQETKLPWRLEHPTYLLTITQVQDGDDNNNTIYSIVDNFYGEDAYIYRGRITNDFEFALILGLIDYKFK